jgi:hypothetical protein
LAACAVGESTDWKHIPHGGRKESAMKRKMSDGESKKKQVKKRQKRKTRTTVSKKVDEIAEDPAFRAIVELAKSLHAIYRQSYELIRHIVNDACKNPQTVDEDELEHLFDQVLDMSCTDYGMRLFTKLCNAFRSRYPECVAAYIKINDELYGEDNEGESTDVSR